MTPKKAVKRLVGLLSGRRSVISSDLRSFARSHRGERTDSMPGLTIQFYSEDWDFMNLCDLADALRAIRKKGRDDDNDKEDIAACHVGADGHCK